MSAMLTFRAEINEKNPKQQSSISDESHPNPPEKSSTPNKAKTVSQTDAELRERLEKMSGEGGAAGIEYEDGKPNAMKRSVRNNMFRLI
ncbi:uncharacterized protein N7459_002884 [Penicillium hispanicum]|uniref:uncharacterized protein n=1 Tax=Penicillium hispanicum TaxID=1080232 RepID=UPI00254227CD|nr:uncharacterized protein N7459_002884 [Penicillium hispanicum]KAJ5587119.1 hypothetical protein N7459_002884 [Penicillium hispanicum]